MAQSLFKQGMEHNKTEGELSAWFAGLSDDEKGQLRNEIQAMLTKLSESVKTLSWLVPKAFISVSEWLDKNIDLISEIHAIAGGEEPQRGGSDERRMRRP